jgi:chaperone modulatory protein CbpM
MQTRQQVCAEISLREDELSAWIEQRWVCPVQRGGEYLFDEIDIARLRFITELRRDLLVNDEAVPIVLSLVDQIHDLRRAMRRLDTALRQISPEIRAEVAKRLDPAR